MTFKVVEGKLSPHYNHFKEYKFEKCVATDTRLMGAVALKIKWVSERKNGSRIFQLIHLDFSEYGIDEYREFVIDAGKEKRSEFQGLKDAWKEISSNLGGSEVELSLNDAVYFIDAALYTNQSHYMDHPEAIQSFRKDTICRIYQMKDAADAYSSYDPLNFHEIRAHIRLLSTNTTAYETINYFIMRLSDHDYDAALYLSDIDYSSLQQFELARKELLTLMKNEIISVKGSGYSGSLGTSYDCKTLLLGNRYYYSISSITVSRAATEHRYVVKRFRENMLIRFSEFEAAMQLKQTEYITVFNLKCRPSEFTLKHFTMSFHAAEFHVPAGMAFIIYNSDNSHVNTDDYRLNGDVYGAYLITNAGELILMSGQIMKINMMEMDIMSGIFSENTELVERYKFDNQIFQTFTKTNGMKFSDILEDYD